MKFLTANQIILLIDLYRGTDTQRTIGTRETDLDHLTTLGLINEVRSLTRTGNDLVDQLKSTTIAYMNIHCKKP